MSLAGWGHTRGTVGACHWGRRLEGGCGAGVLDPTYLPPGPLLRREQQGVGERTRTGIRGAQSGEGSRALGAGRGPPLKATSCSVLALALPLRPPPRSGGLSPARSSGPGPGWAHPQCRSVCAEGPAEFCSAGGRCGDGTNPMCQKETQEWPRGRVATEGVPRL